MSLQKSLFVELNNGNIATVIGDKNITIQGVQHSTITIGANGTEIEELSKMLQANNRHLYFVIPSDFEQQPADWKPFGKRDILSLMKDATKSITNATVFVCFLNLKEPLEEVFLAYLKFIKLQTILVLDNALLDKAAAQKIAAIYNDFHIGGCITVPHNTAKDDMKTLILNHLEEYCKEPLMDVVLKNFHFGISQITNDTLFKQRLNNIITTYMRYDTKPASPIFKQIERIKPEDTYKSQLDTL